MAQIIDGKKIAAQIRGELKMRVNALAGKQGIIPGLAVITVGDDPASLTYVRMKERACAEVGISTRQISFPAEVAEEQLLRTITELNADRAIHGILVQLPLPGRLDEHRLLSAIAPRKDADGFHPVNIGRLLLGMETVPPCTPAGIVELLERSGGSWNGRNVVIIGRSNIVGKPLAAMLMQKGSGGDATVTLCHSRTRDLHEHTRRADIVVAAVGRPRLLTAEMVREGVTVIDVGINRVDDETVPRGCRLVGDVDFDAVSAKAEMITPVPGGVGPMTVAMLLRNTINAAGKHTLLS